MFDFLNRDLRTKAPGQILFNFCIALTLTLIVFLVAAERSTTSSTASCRAAAIALHYFVLAVFMWMAVEAYNMYLGFVKILPVSRSFFMAKCLFIGWGKLIKMKFNSKTINTHNQFDNVVLLNTSGVIFSMHLFSTYTME